MSNLINQLTGTVPPPDNPVHSGTREQWRALLADLKLTLPDDLFDLSRTYGSGSFVEGNFWLSIHSVFRPRFDLLIDWNKKIFTSLAQKQPDPYAHMFQIGAYGSRDDQDLLHGIFWDTRGTPDEWMIGLSTYPKRLDMSLTEFLVKLFTNQLVLAGFPSHFENVQFVPAGLG